MNIFISIATCGKRNDWLIGRALLSVYEQELINRSKVFITIVYDKLQNEKSLGIQEYKNITNELIQELREKKSIKENEFRTYIIENERTKNNSGTGSWNTAIEFISNNFNTDNSYFAILDDDDEYKSNYLILCLQQIKESRKQIAGIFTRIEWLVESNRIIHELTINNLTQREFFIGNPGVQGSNIFILYSIIKAIGGFDESLPSCTDRDLMIRFLDYYNDQKEKYSLIVIESPLVVYHAHSGYRVTTDSIKKKIGLDIFYKKYKERFSEADFKKSIERAQKYFRYEYIRLQE